MSIPKTGSAKRKHLIICLFTVLIISPVIFCLYADAQQRKTSYITGSYADVREQPNPDAKIIITLPINSPVEVVTMQDDWVRIHEKRQGWLGWIHKDFIGSARQTFEEMWENYRKAPINKKQDRIKWLERAHALEPTSIKTLEELIKIFNSIGDNEKSLQYKEKADYIKNPELFDDKNEPAIFFIYYRNFIEPVAFRDKSNLKKVFTSQKELDELIVKYLRPGRRYFLISDNRNIGTAVITHSTIPGSINLEGCYGAVLARVRPAFNRIEKNTNLIIASNRNSNSGIIVKQRNLSSAGKVIIEKHAFSAIRDIAKISFPEGEKISQMETETSGSSRDLDRDGQDELIGSVHYYYKDPAGPPSDVFETAVMVVLKKGRDETYTPIFSIFTWDKTDSLIGQLKILGFADLNNDGIDDIVTQELGYESVSIKIYISTGNTYTDSNTGSKTGC